MRALLLLVAALAACAAPTRSAEPVPLTVATADWRILGESREGRPVRATDLGAGGPRVAIIAGIHGNEQEGLRHLDELLGVVDPMPAPVRVYEDANPDGTAANRRGTSTGVDPKRNWPASNFKRDPRRIPDPRIGTVEMGPGFPNSLRVDPAMEWLVETALSSSS